MWMEGEVRTVGMQKCMEFINTMYTQGIQVCSHLGKVVGAVQERIWPPRKGKLSPSCPVVFAVPQRVLSASNDTGCVKIT